MLGLTSDTLPLTTVDAYAENILPQKTLADIRRRPGGRRRSAEAGDPRPTRSAGARGSRHESRRRAHGAGQANVDLPKGTLNGPRQTYTLDTNDQLLKADQFDDLVIAYRNGAPVRVRDVGRAISAPENDLIAGWFNQQRAVLLAIQRQPGANVIATVERIKIELPQLEASIPAGIKVSIDFRPHRKRSAPPSPTSNSR